MKKTFCVFLGIIAMICLFSYRVVLLSFPSQPLKNDFDIFDTTTIYSPLQDVDIQGCTAYLFINQSDLNEVPDELRNSQCWKTNDPTKLETLKHVFKFTGTGGELGTCDSRFILKRGLTTIYDTRIVLTNGYFVVEGGGALSKYLDETITLFESFEHSNELFIFDL